VAPYLTLEWGEGLPEYGKSQDGYERGARTLTSLVGDATLDRPVLVYIRRSEMEGDEALKEERRLFGHDEVVLGMRFFDCYRLDVAKLDPSSREKFAGKLPAILLIGEDGEVVEHLLGRRSQSEVFSKLGKAFVKSYSEKLSPRVRKLVSVFKEYQRVEYQMAGYEARAGYIRGEKVAKAKAHKKFKYEQMVKELQGKVAVLRKELEKLGRIRDGLLEAPGAAIAAQSN